MIRLLSRIAATLPCLALIAAASPAQEPPFEAVRATDAALARIGYRLAVASAPLCDRLEPGLGLVLHMPDQYARGIRDKARQHFGFAGPVGVEAVIPNSPATRGGINPDDTILSIGGARFAAANFDARESTGPLIQVAAQIAALAPDRALKVTGIDRAGQAFEITIDPVPACRTRFEVVISSEFIAKADGEMVQLSSRFLAEYPEEWLAAAIAHELAHNILRHRESLEAQGVSYGMLAGVGRNAALFRQTEMEADRLSVTLLANARYDPGAAIQFWRSYGPQHAGGMLRSRSHPRWQDRIAAMEAAIAELPPERPVISGTRQAR